MGPLVVSPLAVGQVRLGRLLQDADAIPAHTVFTGDYKDPLHQCKMPQAKCLSCKEHGSCPDLVETTADWNRNPHNSHWGEMECDICHNQHRASVLYCTNCHNDV